MGYFQRLIVNTLTFVSLSVLLPHVIYVSDIKSAILASFVLSILNALVRPILVVLSLPLTVLSLGLFTFVINAGMLILTANLLGQTAFAFGSFGAAILVAVIMSVVNMIVSEHALRKYDQKN